MTLLNSPPPVAKRLVSVPALPSQDDTTARSLKTTNRAG